MNTPEGRITRADVLSRGWTASMANRLTDVQKFPADEVPTGTSPRHYSLAEVEHIEGTDPEVRKAVRALRSQVPRIDGPVEKSDTWSRGSLIERGWTAGMIVRLLGEPDLVLESLGRPVHRWAVSRIRQAEATDAKLQARQAAHHEAQAVERAHAIEDVIKSGECVWRRHGDEWLAQGRDLMPGQHVSITRRDGRTDLHRVVQVVATGEGLTLARVEKWTPPPPQPDLSDVAAQPKARAERAPRTIIPSIQTPITGAIITLAAPLGPAMRRITVTRVLRAVTIDEDMPSLYGAHLLGHEDSRGWLIEYKETEQ